MEEKILIIEDDADLLEGLSFSFGSDNYEVVGVGTKKEGMEELECNAYDIVILDCNLPDGSGFELCKYVRKYSDIPIVMLTARDTELDEIKALELGANDFMSKPFSLGVLKARVKRILRESAGVTRLVSNRIAVEKNTCKVYKNNKEIVLSKLEYKLLLYLMENKNHVLSKEQILDYVWDSDGRYVDENTVSVNISRLRAKMEDDAAHPVLIKTVHGVGYLWKED